MEFVRRIEYNKKFGSKIVKDVYAATGGMPEDLARLSNNSGAVAIDYGCCDFYAFEIPRCIFAIVFL